eukprot:RCo038928
MSRRRQNPADDGGSQVKPAHLRVFVGFTTPPQSVVVTADTRWNVDNIRVLVVDLLVRNGCELSSAQPFDYTLRFETPEDKVYVPKEAEKVSAPGLVLEKSQDLLEREAYFKAQREEVLKRAQAELAAREREQEEYERHRQALAEAIRKEAERVRFEQERSTMIQERRERNVMTLERIQEQMELGQVKHCEQRELARRLQWAADRAPPPVRWKLQYPPPRPLTKRQLLLARLEDGILRAAESREALAEQWGRAKGPSSVPLPLCCPPSDPARLTNTLLGGSPATKSVAVTPPAKVEAVS